MDGPPGERGDVGFVRRKVECVAAAAMLVDAREVDRQLRAPAHRVAIQPRADRAKPLFPAFEELDDRLQGILTRSNNVRGHEGKTGRELYAALSDEAKAGLLNISKKSLATEFRNGGDLLPHLVLIDILGDRCFVEVPRTLVDQMPQLVDEHVRLVLSRSVDALGPVEFSAADGCEAWAIQSDSKITDEVARPGQALGAVDVTPE